VANVLRRVVHDSFNNRFADGVPPGVQPGGQRLREQGRSCVNSLRPERPFVKPQELQQEAGERRTAAAGDLPPSSRDTPSNPVGRSPRSPPRVTRFNWILPHLMRVHWRISRLATRHSRPVSQAPAPHRRFGRKVGLFRIVPFPAATCHPIIDRFHVLHGKVKGFGRARARRWCQSVPKRAKKGQKMTLLGQEIQKRSDSGPVLVSFSFGDRRLWTQLARDCGSDDRIQNEVIGGNLW
jgi:hypothetical protein